MNLFNGSFGVGLAGWLADFYLLATLLMLAAILAQRWMRQPSQRLTVDWIVAVELAALAVVCALPFWPRISLRGPASAIAAKSVAEPPQTAELPIPVEPPIAADRGPLASPQATWSPAIKPEPVIDVPLKPAARESAPPPAPSSPLRSWIERAAVAYLACTAIVVLWLAWGASVLALACRRADYAPRWLQAELSRIIGDGAAVPRLLVSSRAKTAVALGLRRPTILLPAGLIHGGPTPDLRAVLAHEWAHIRSGDLWLLALGRCLLVLLFAHPLFWWWRRMIRGDQELLADAAAAGDDRPAYAEELLRLVRKATNGWPLAASASVGIWEGSSQLSRRIAMLLDENFCIEPKTSSGWRYRALGLLAVLGVAASLLTFQPRRSTGDEGPGKTPVTSKAASTDAKEAYEKGKACLDKQDYDAAITAFTEAIRLDPKHARSYCGRGVAYAENDQYDKAIADYSEAIRLDPKNAKAYNHRGYANAKKGDFDRAIADFTETIRLDPKNAGAYSNRGYADFEKADLQQAIADCTEAIRLDPQSADAYNNRGRAYHNRRERDKAILDYGEAIRLNPKHAAAYNNRGITYFWKGEYDKAITDLTEAIRLDPKNASVYSFRGAAYGKKGVHDRAIADLTEAIRLDPKNAWAYHVRCLIYEKIGDKAKADEDFAKAEKLGYVQQTVVLTGVDIPTKPEFFYLLEDQRSTPRRSMQVPPLIPDDPEQAQPNGTATSKSDSTNVKAAGGLVESSAIPAQPTPKIGIDGALPAPANKPDAQRTIEDLTNAIRLDPKNAGAYYARGNAYYEKRDMTRAISDFSEAIRLRPKDASAYFGRGNAYGGRHEFGLAIEDFTQAIQLGLANSDSYANRGGAYASINRSKEAFADFNEAIRQDPKFAYAYLGRGASRMAAGDFDKAIVDLTESIRLDPNYGYSYYYRALTYLKRGDKSKAEEDFTRAKNLGVDAPRPVELSTQPSIPGELAAFALPAYSMISQEDFRKSLQVSPQQVRELQDISKAIAQQRQEGLDRSGKESANVPIERRDAWLSQKYKELDQELAIACGKRVERVLTSHQIDIYKTWVLPLRVYPMLHDPEIRKVLAISHDQDQFLARIEGEWGKQAGDQEIEYHDRLLALLNRQQREKLSVRMESGRFTARDDVQNQTKDLELPLGPFAELAKPTVRARVGFSLDQQNQIKQISAAYSKDRPEYADRLRKNSLEYKEALERRSAEGPATGPRLRGPDEIQEDNKDIFAKLLRKEGEAVQKIDALLTTEQRTKLKEIDFGNQAAIAVFDHSIAAEIGVTQQQEARRDQMASQFQQSQASLGRVAALKAFALLSPAQQSTLRDECDRRASW